MEYQNWHRLTGAKNNFELMLSKFKDLPNLEYLQIGVFVGYCSAWLFKNVLTHETSRLTDIDSWDLPRTYLVWEEKWGQEGWLEVEKSYDERISPYKDKTIKIKDYSKNWLISNRDKRYDLIYIDGDHSKQNVIEDAILSWDLLKNNGILVFDDYTWISPSGECAKTTIDAFVDIYKDKIEILLSNTQLWIKKTNDTIY